MVLLWSMWLFCKTEKNFDNSVPYSQLDILLVDVPEVRIRVVVLEVVLRQVLSVPMEVRGE